MSSLAASVRVVLLLPLLVMAGCKVVLEVPTGGTVVSQSGTYECGEQQSCVIDVEDVNFDEVFVATPQEDYDFVGWKERTGGLCSAPDSNTGPCPVTTATLALVPQLLGLLDMDISVYLEPEFAIKESATIIYPTANTVAIGLWLTVRGIASDPDGVAAVHVNDTAATLTPVVMEAGKNYPTQVSWQAWIRLEDGNAQIGADVTDADGIVSSDSATASIEMQRVPYDFVLDAANNRILSPFFGNGFDYDLVAMDLDTGETSTVSKQFTSTLPQCVKPDTGELFHLTVGEDDQVALHSYDLNTGIDSVVATTLLEPAQDEGATLEAKTLACGSGIDEAYLTYNYLYQDAPNVSTGETEDFSYITAFNLASGEGRLLSTIPKQGEWDFPLSGAKFVGDQLVAWRLATFVFTGNPLLLIDRVTGEDSFFATQNFQNIVDIASDPLTGTIYITNNDGVFAIPGGTTGFEIVSLDGNEDELQISTPRQTAVDADNNRLLIGDFGLDSVIGVDLSTGNREVVNKQLGGTGEPLDRPVGLHIMDDGRTAYVLDSKFGQKPRLVEIDLSSGNRQVVGDISRFFQQQGTGLAVDEEAGKAYIAFNEQILEMDLATEEEVTVAAQHSGTGVTFSTIADIALDKAKNRLLIADSNTDSLLAMDLDSRKRSLVSAEGAMGSGLELTGITNLAIDYESNTAFATILEPNRIVAIDLDTGDRQVLLETCIGTEGTNLLGRDQQPEELHYHNGTLWIGYWSVMALDLESGVCAQSTPLPSAAISAMRSFEDSDDLLYVTALNYLALGVLDAITGEFVILSD